MKKIVKTIYRFFVNINVFIRCKKLKIKFTKGCFIGKNVTRKGNVTIILGKNSFIQSGCHFWGSGVVKIGDNTSIGENTWIYASKQGGVYIGDNCTCAANAYIIDSNHQFKIGQLIKEQDLVSEKICIGSDVWIGANSTFLKGSGCGDGCVIGACSCLTRYFGEKNLVIAGVPAKILKKRI